MNRIDELFRTRRENILSVFFTAGYPSTDSVTEIIRDLAKAGVDMIEIGMPFSDPIADGPVIQRSSEIALQKGMSIKLLFNQLADIRKTVSIPLLLMGYINPVLKFGVANFCNKCAETGIDGVILPDLPPDIYINQYSGIFEKKDIYNIFLITPQMDYRRIRTIDSVSRGFLYLVSSFSITGMKGNFTEEQLSYFRRVSKMNLKNPGLIGFGISDKATFRSACDMANGAILGSAFVRMLTETGGGFENIKDFVNDLIQ
jgi:tryptophan synthase alpha chain